MERDENMANDLVILARGLFEEQGAGGRSRYQLDTDSKESDELPQSRGTFDSARLSEQRAAYQERIVVGLDYILSAQSPLLPSPACVLDHTAWIQVMIAMGNRGEASLSKRGRHWMDMEMNAKQALIW